MNKIIGTTTTLLTVATAALAVAICIPSAPPRATQTAIVHNSIN